MNVTETSASDLKRELTVQIPRADIDNAVEQRLTELRGSINLPGFRPGKIPMKVLRQRYGQSVMGEVLERIVGQSSAKALQEKNLRPAMQPDIEVTKFDAEGDLEYKMTLEVMPPIEPMDLTTIALERPVAKATEEQIEEALGRIAEQHAEAVDINEDRPAAEGDQIVMDFDGTVDGEPRDGMKAEDMPLVLGSGQLIPGFEEQLIGAKPGEERSVTVTFPDDYHAEELRSREAVFAVKVKAIQERKPAALDDALAEKMGESDIAALRDKIKSRIEEELRSISRSRAKRTLLDILAENHDFPVPEAMLKAEFDTIWKRFQEEKEAGNLSPAEAAKTDDEAQAEYREIAERRVRLGLLLTTIGENARLQVSDEEVNRAIAQQAMQMPQQARQIFDFYQQNPQATERLKAPIYEDKVVDYIFEVAQVTDKEVSVEELSRDPDEEEAAEDQKPKKTAAKKQAARKPAAKKAAAKKPAAKKAASDDKPAANKAAAKKPATKKAPAKKAAAKPSDKSEA